MVTRENTTPTCSSNVRTISVGDTASHELAFGSLEINPAWALTAFVGTNTEAITMSMTATQVVRSRAITTKS